MSIKPLIIGAGVAGPAVALTLRRLGMNPKIFEAAAGVSTGGFAVGISPNGLAALKAMDTLDLVTKNGHPIASVTNRLPDGSLLASLHTYGSECTTRYGNTQIAIRRAVLLEGLTQRAKDAGVQFNYNKQLVAISESDADGGSVTATFADGTSETGDLLIACDGLRSLARSYVCGDRDEAPVYTGAVNYYGNASFPDGATAPPDPNLVMTSADGWMWGQYKTSNSRNEYTWWAARRAPPEPESWKTTASEEHLQLLKRELAHWGPLTHAMLDHTTSVAAFGLYNRPPTARWSHGRVVLVGDAVHPMTPNIGQGANCALEDAVVLAKCLARYPDHNVAFARFEALRKERTAKIVADAARVNATSYVTNPLASWALRQITKVVFGIPSAFFKVAEYPYAYDAGTVEA
ncbi:hypothetical protein HDU89_000070 [Geranomyces variabilis]|nr:hypothetical protein HDU89_000070 [Geranomyces variabilis]